MSDWFRRHRAEYPADWDEIATRIKALAGWRCDACGVAHGKAPYRLTVHHHNRRPAECDDANLIALCQRDHLRAHGLRYRHLTRDQLIAELRRRAEIELGQLCLPLSISEVPL